MGLARWWNRISGAPARALMRRLSSQLPRRDHDGIELVVAEPLMAPSAERFFERTSQALGRAAAGAPRAYAELKQEIERVVLLDQPVASPYHKFQLALVVPRRVALESDATCYAAWLLRASGRGRGESHAQARLDEFVGSLDPAEQSRVVDWVGAVEGPPRGASAGA